MALLAQAHTPGPHGKAARIGGHRATGCAIHAASLVHAYAVVNRLLASQQRDMPGGEGLMRLTCPHCGLFASSEGGEDDGASVRPEEQNGYLLRCFERADWLRRGDAGDEFVCPILIRELRRRRNSGKRVSP